MSFQYTGEHWLSRYATNYHAWRKAAVDDQEVFIRRTGVVESAFDTDGSDFEGRADVFALLTLEVRSSLSIEEYRRRISLAWANLCVQHVLLMARVLRDPETDERQFAVTVPKSKEDILAAATQSTVFLDDFHQRVDAEDFLRHCLNTARVVHPDESLARLFVLPQAPGENGRAQLQFVIIAGHEITDGLSMYNWTSHFVEILNLSVSALETDMELHCTPAKIWSRLPPAQEDLYPKVPGSLARQRWFWAIMRILRHVRRPLPPAFVNPLRRAETLVAAAGMPEKYLEVLNYAADRRPPLNTFSARVMLPRRASARLERLCRAAKVSIVAMAMMELEEARHPGMHLHERQPFISGFPLNPKPLFGYKGPSDSCMLAFCDGIVLPFLASDLDVEGRFRLVARQAHRQLRVYQKRLREGETQSAFDPHSPARLIATTYLGTVEREDSKRPPARRRGTNPQGAYPANINMAGATCGVSSIGSVRHLLDPGKHDLNKQDGKDFVADFRKVDMGVRARDNEFLVGCVGTADGISFAVSFDGNAIDEDQAQRWKEKMVALLDFDDKARL